MYFSSISRAIKRTNPETNIYKDPRLTSLEERWMDSSEAYEIEKLNFRKKQATYCRGVLQLTTILKYYLDIFYFFSDTCNLNVWLETVVTVEGWFQLLNVGIFNYSSVNCTVLFHSFKREHFVTIVTADSEMLISM